MCNTRRDKSFNVWQKVDECNTTFTGDYISKIMQTIQLQFNTAIYSVLFGNDKQK